MSEIEYGHHISYKNILKIIIVYLLIFLPVVFVRYPDIRNEIKYFIVADNMIESKNYFILKYFSELYPDKPPLYFWLLSFLKEHFSKYFVPLAVLFGSTIPSLLLTIFSYSLFAKMRNEKTGFLIALSLCTIPFFIGTSVFLRMDILMTFFIVFALYKFFFMYYCCAERNLFNLITMYLSIALAILTKGPAGAAVPICTILTFLLLEKNMKFLKEIHFIKGIMLVLGIMALWLYAIYLQPEGKEYISLLLGQETIGRVVKSKTHIQPVYYYLERIPLIMFPYGILFIGSLVYYIKNIKSYSKWDELEKIGFAWTVIPFILFSLASGKLEIYLIPMFPGMIAMVYAFIFKTQDTKVSSILIKISMILLVFPLLFDKFFNKKKDFYKKLMCFPAGVITVFLFVSQGMKLYNSNFTLKPVVEIINSDNKNITAYRFPDFLNVTNIVGQSFENISNTDELKNKLEDKDNMLIVGRTKYEKDLQNIPDLNFVYKNRTYCVYSK